MIFTFIEQSSHFLIKMQHKKEVYKLGFVLIVGLGRHPDDVMEHQNVESFAVMILTHPPPSWSLCDQTRSPRSHPDPHRPSAWTVPRPPLMTWRR